MSVLDHAISSFVSGSTVTTLSVDFGTLTQGTGTTSQNLSIFNRAGPMGATWTAKLDLDSVVASVPGSVFSTTLSPFTNLASGSSRTYGLSMLTTTTGSFSGTYTLNTSDEDLPGATSQSMLVNVRGNVVSPANAILNVASGTQTQSNLGFGPITGPSSLTKTGSGTILLDGLNTFTGTTSVEQGIAALNGPGAIASSSLVTVAAGASLDAQSLSGGYTVPSGQTLGGSGTVLGSVVFGRGSTLSPGMAGVAMNTMQIAAVPEPSAWVIAVAGLGCISYAQMRRRNRG
jgi:autotransporter-associated beta strand protein